MFEDKRFSENDELNKNRFFMPEDNTGLKDGNQNLNFQQQTSYVPEPEPISRKPKKQINYKPIIISLIVILVLGVLVGTFFVVKEVLTSPIKIYERSINEGYELLNAYFKEINSKRLNYDINLDTLANSGTLKVESNIPGVSSFNNLPITYKLVLDAKNEQADLSLNVSENKSLIDLQAYLRDKKLYLKENNMYNQWLEVFDISSFNMESVKNNIETNDILNVVKVIKNYVSANLNKDNVTKEVDNIKINEENVKVNSNIYRVSGEDLAKHLEKILEALADDDNALESLADLTFKTKRDIQNILRELNKKEDLFIDVEDLEFKIYTKGLTNTFVGVSVIYDGKELFNFGFVGDKKEINIAVDGLSINSLITGNKNNVTVKVLKEEVVKATIEKSGDKVDIDFNVTNQETQIKGTLSYEEKRVGDKRKTLVLQSDVTATIEGKTTNVKINLDNMAQVGTKLDNVNINESKKINDLTSDDIKNIQNNMAKALEDTPLYWLYDSFEEIIKSKLDMCDIASDCYCDEDGVHQCKYVDDNHEEHIVECGVCW